MPSSSGNSRYTASVRVVWPAVRLFESEHGSVERLLRPFDLSNIDLTDRDSRIPQNVVTDLWDRASELSPEPSFGLRALAATPGASPSLAEYVLLNSPTLRAMIERGIRYERLWQEGREASLEERGPLAVIRWTARAGLRFSPALSEYALARFVLLSRVATGMVLDRAEAEVRFLHPAPADVSRYEALFGCEVRFSAGEQALEFGAHLLETPLPKADPALLQVVEAGASDALSRLPPVRSVAQAVREALVPNLAEGVVSLETTAQKLQMSSRSLRRKLAQEGSTHHEVLSELRHHLALHYLRDPRLSVTETAFLLGFAETAAFSKAFRRWTSLTPSAARRKALGG